jgi:hypothetical protein
MKSDDTWPYNHDEEEFQLHFKNTQKLGMMVAIYNSSTWDGGLRQQVHKFKTSLGCMMG